MKAFVLLALLLFLVPAVIAESETREFQLDAYGVYAEHGYEIIRTPNTDVSESYGSLAEPVATASYEFSQGRVIKDILIKDMKESVAIVANLPGIEWDDQQNPVYIDRDCTINSRDPFVDYGLPIYSNVTYVDVDIYPLGIINCDKGQFRLWGKLTLEFEFEDKNSFTVTKLADIKPGRPVTFKAVFDNTPSGEILVEGEYGEIDSFNAGAKEVLMIFTATETEMQEYDFHYYEGDDVIAAYHYEEDIGWGDLDFRVLNSSSGTRIDLAIEVINILKETTPLEIEIYSVDREGNPGSEKMFTLDAKPGRKIYYTDINIRAEEKTNDIAIIATYDGVSVMAQHNTIIKFGKEETQRGLPISPGEDILKGMADVAMGKKPELEKEGSSLPSSTIIGIIITVILFIAMGIVAYNLFGKD